MAVALPSEVLEDALAISLARAMAAANSRARSLGIDLDRTLITITQLVRGNSSVWQINYGPKDYVGRRGGDVLIEVDMLDGTIARILRGQ